MDFDQIVDRRGTHSMKWDSLQKKTGVAADDGIAMWVADMDFRAPDCVQQAVQRLHDNANYGYFDGIPKYLDTVSWWMQERHGWTVDTDWIFTTYGLGNAIGLLLQTFTDPGDGVVIFTPVYHVFLSLIKNAGRSIVELEMPQQDGVYEMDFEHFQTQLTGREKAVILCSPHNPAGRVWSRKDLEGLAEFCARNDLLIISDDIHHDLVLPGHSYVPLPLVVPDVADRLVMLTSASKTFNIAGTRTGNVIISDATLHAKFKAALRALSIAPNLFGIFLTQAAYSPAGAAWVDELMMYLDGNRRLFDAEINAIPGLKAMPMQATYLAWVDFAGTGLSMTDVQNRVAKRARIGVTLGRTLGKGGETFLRFNIGTQRARVAEAAARLKEAFADLQ
jgi:cystathionine beta-lyase